MSSTPKSLLRGRTHGHPVKAANHLPAKAERNRPLSRASRPLSLMYTPPVAGYNSSSTPRGVAGGEGVREGRGASATGGRAAVVGLGMADARGGLGCSFHIISNRGIPPPGATHVCREALE